MFTLILSFITAIVACLLIMPLVISLSKKLKVRQTILHYVDNHSLKSGTPTMGGIGFVLVLTATFFIFARGDMFLATLSILTTIGFGLIGFFDDYLKVHYHQNKGLSVIQKIIFQLAISLIVSVFCYYNTQIGAMLYYPFLNGSFSMSYFIIPFNIIMMLAVTNSVNLVDGLDGLASKVTIQYLVFFVISVCLTIYLGDISASLRNELDNIILLVIILIGALIGFVFYNGFPAQIFMGDTGSLALGGFVASTAIVTKLVLILPIFGIIYVITCISVVMQVAYYKLTKKRIFLMAPLHHHFERKGMHENKVNLLYSLIGLIVGSANLFAIYLCNF